MSRKLKRVIVLSPYKGNIEVNVAYAKRCMLDSMRRYEAPFASHLVYTQILDDGDPAKRALGFQCEAAWMKTADLLAVYSDLGISSGMKKTMDKVRGKIAIVVRTLDETESSKE